MYHKAVRLFWQAGIFNQRDKPEIRKEYGSLTGQEWELYVYDRENMRTNLDIAGDYINEASGIIRELREGLQDG